MNKFCKRCQTETERYKDLKCKVCVSVDKAAQYAANPGKKKASVALYRATNPEKVKDSSNKYYTKNKEARNAASRAGHAKNREREKGRSVAYYAANGEKSREAARVYYIENKEACKVRGKAWQLTNLAAFRGYHQNRRARKLAVGGQLSPGLVGKLLTLQKGKCPCCYRPLGEDYHLDHIMPLYLGGANEDWNMQLLTATCNLQKGYKHPVEFMQSRGFLL